MGALLRAVWAVLAITWASSPSWAQDYPTRTVRIIVPFGAGGPADVYGRIIAQNLSTSLKQSFIIENRPGAGTIIGTDAAAKAAPDGYNVANCIEHARHQRVVDSKQTLSTDA